MYWYVLFVKSGKERKVEQCLRKELDTDISIPFIPLQEILFRRSGTVRKEIRPLFPGYVFIESILPGQDFLEETNYLINKSGDIISLLKYSDTEVAMKESEKLRLLSLCNNDHCIEVSYGIIEGDKIHIFDGPLKGMESIVRKVNRHKREALIEIEIMGDVRLVTVALEVVKKVPDCND
ncbi:antiterminator LoaP [Acetivibrio mesophilus]|uniref:Antiterminator LoaP n=1 Tax=Acetivibrio mesophilus TaxID=2487273 RepID=A0A4Q0I358_9FIRM|nr:antiterminator LoaP [Acetivibrio mesophilus]RXE58673.1 antiterminator LoaP [Acetivibrio mesophilus]